MRARLRTSSRVRGALCLACLLLTFGGCGSSHHSTSTSTSTAKTTATSVHGGTSSSGSVSSLGHGTRSRRRRLIAILPASRRQGLFDWTPAVRIGGQAAVWISRVPAFGEAGFTITLLRFDQRLVTLALHAGASQPGGRGWRYGDSIADGERREVVAAFNSAFQEGYGAGGFEEGGRTGWPLRPGMASAVIYGNGTADIGRWQRSVPAAGRRVEAVRQNLGLLIRAGRIAATVDTCIKVCWGDPLHEQPIVARSALGIMPGGDLVWAAGHDISVRALAEALAGKGVVRAMELDINPRWVAGYLYAHPRHRVAVPIPVVPGQTGIPGEFFKPYFRDFFTVTARKP